MKDNFDDPRDGYDEPMPRKRSQRCQCGDDLPGRCPGVDACPFSDRHDDDCEEETSE